MQSQLEDLLRQIEEIKQTIPQLQGTVDVNFKEQTLSFDKVDTKLQDFDNTLKNEAMNLYIISLILYYIDFRNFLNIVEQ